MKLPRKGSTAGRDDAGRRTVIAIVLNSFVNDYRVLKTCRSLTDAGYLVRVVALHDGRSELPERDVVHGLDVHRIRLRTKGWGRNPLVQLVKYFEFVIRAAAEYRGAAVYHCNDLGALPVGLACRLLSSVRPKIIYDAHELEPERAGVSRRMRALIRIVERALIRYADRMITVSPSIADEYRRLYRRQRPEVVLNVPYYREKVQYDLLRERFGISEQTRIFVYQGILSRGRGLPLLLRVFSGIEIDCCIVFIGSGELEAEIAAAAARSDKIYHVPNVDPLELSRLTMSGDFGVALIENVSKSYDYCLPNKLFEFLVAELPVLVSNVFEMSRFVQQHGVGVVSELDEQTVEAKVRELMRVDKDEFVRNIRKIKRTYTWEEQEPLLLRLYAGLLDLNLRGESDKLPVHEA